MFDQAFASIAVGFAAKFGGPFHDATATWPGVPTRDDGGSIVSPGTPLSKACKAQISAPTQAMREDAGFLQTDMRLIVLAASLDVALDTSATVVVSGGPHAGTWEPQTCTLDTAGVGWVCRGRKAA